MKRIVASFLVLLMVGASWRSMSSTSVAESNSNKVQEIDLLRCRVLLIDTFILASDRPGILEFVEPEEGDQVQGQQTIAKLKDEVAQAVLARTRKQAENDVQERYAKKAADVAEAELIKAEDANKALFGTIPEIEIKRLRLAFERSQLQIEQAQHDFAVSKLELNEALATLETYKIIAPMDGVITRIFKKRGEAVRQGDPILELVNTDRLKVEGYVNVRNIQDVKVGQKVIVILELPENLTREQKTFSGNIAFVDVKVQPVTKRLRVWAEVENKNNVLKDGMTATMTIDLTDPNANKTTRR